MRPSTSPIRTDTVQNARRSRRSISSTERPPRPLAAGRGIHSVSSAGARLAETTEPHLRTSAISAYKRGAATTPPRLRTWIGENTSSKSTVCLQSTSRPCALAKAESARSASEQHRASSWITATPRATSGLCSARRATRFSVGTRRRPTRFFASSGISKLTAPSLDQPCHADILLEIANGPLSDGAPTRQDDTHEPNGMNPK